MWNDKEMGRKSNWFSTVKKALSPESKEKEQKANKSKKSKWFGKQNHPSVTSTSLDTVSVSRLPPPEEVKLTDVENELTRHAYSAATAEVSEASVAAAHANSEVVQPTRVSRFSGKASEEVAAIKIQTAFRGYLARRALRALRGLVRLTSLVQGSAVMRQATNTLRCMQTLARVQSQIRARRIRMSEDNQALQKQLLQTHAKELENLRMGEEWDDSLQSKDQIEASMLSKQEAAIRRERALAYAFSHQQTMKNSSKSTNPMFMDPSNPSWGWSWLERWMAARPWESRSLIEKELNNEKSASRSIAGGEINKAYARHQLNSDKYSPATTQKSNHQSPSTPPSKPASLKPVSLRKGLDDDSKSMLSMQSERSRRHSIAGSSVRDDESMASSSAVPSYMTPTESAKAKSRLGAEKNGMLDVGSVGSVGSTKKRLSFPASPTRPRRHSGPPRVGSGSIAVVSVSNGGGS